MKQCIVSSCFIAAVVVAVNSCLSAIGRRFDGQVQSQEGRNLVTCLLKFFLNYKKNAILTLKTLKRLSILMFNIHCLFYKAHFN